MMDTDEEVTNGRVTLLNGNGPPYFHGYLYMKGGYILFKLKRWLCQFQVKPSPPFELYYYDNIFILCSLSWSDDPMEEALVCAEG